MGRRGAIGEVSGRFAPRCGGGKETGASSVVKEITRKKLKAKIDRGRLLPRGGARVVAACDAGNTKPLS